MLSQAGKEILLKVMVQAIPMFAMSCFKLRVMLCHDIEVMIHKFWWSQWGNRRKIYWKNWESLCLAMGGMDFRALMAKCLVNQKIEGRKNEKSGRK